MITNKFIDSNDLKLSLGEIHNSLSTVNAKAIELTNDIATIKEQVDNIRNATLGHSIPDVYTLAKDTDFEWSEDFPWDGAWHYIGVDEKVIIPHIINGEKVTSYRGMFSETSVNGVYSDNTNVTDMSHMFYKSEAATLDLSGFDTSNATDMGGMFSDSQATSLDLSSFNTTSVVNMDYMFYDSHTDSLDLSSFDTSSVISMGLMFNDYLITEGYARTQEDADRFNASGNKPSTLTFMVRSQAN